MKYFWIPALMLASLAGVQAGFELPRHVFRTDKMAEAVEKAKEGDKALAFVYTDETST
jgi:hypothetical protein